jgi:signal transduction histidine kinase
VWDVLTTDVTAEKRAEEAQRESEERLRTVAGNLPGFLFECFIDRREDIRLRFLSAGHFEIGRRFGADAESSGVTLLDLVHPDDRQSVRQVALDAARTRSPWECTFRSVISGAEECWLRALAQPRSTEDGHLVWDGLALDETVRVTEARRNEQLQAKLRQGEKMESLGTLAGGVAHELNNLLQPITMMTEMVLENLPEASREAAQLRRVVDASGKAAEIVGRILSFGRAEDVTYRSLDIGEVVREAAAFMRAMLPRSITLHVDVAAEVGRIRGNRTQLTQVLMNMATNARDAIGANVGGIWIGLERADLPDPAPTANIGSLRAAPYAAISVRDDGCGMDRETMRRMFEPFFTTKDVGKGTGLGLSVTHGIIIGHDGAIRVESTPGKGTAFTIYLPLGSRNGATQTEGD